MSDKVKRAIADAFLRWEWFTLPFERRLNPRRARRKEQMLRDITWARAEGDRIIRLLDTDPKAGREALEKFAQYAEQEFAQVRSASRNR